MRLKTENDEMDGENGAERCSYEVLMFYVERQQSLRNHAVHESCYVTGQYLQWRN